MFTSNKHPIHMDLKKKEEAEDLAHVTRMLKGELQARLDPGLKQWLAQLRTCTPLEPIPGPEVCRPLSGQACI